MATRKGEPLADELKVIERLREVIRARVPAGGYAAFDRKIGRAGTGWTSKFLRGNEGVGTLAAFLKILRALEVDPSAFFGEKLPPGTPPAQQDEDEVARMILAALTGAGATAIQKLIDQRIAEKLSATQRQPGQARSGSAKKRLG